MNSCCSMGGSAFPAGSAALFWVGAASGRNPTMAGSTNPPGAPPAPGGWEGPGGGMPWDMRAGSIGGLGPRPPAPAPHGAPSWPPWKPPGGGIMGWGGGIGWPGIYCGGICPGNPGAPG